MMKRIFGAISGILLLGAGLVGGGVLADAARLSFREVTLCGALKEANASMGLNSVSETSPTAAKTFAVETGAPREVARKIARQYGRGMTMVSGVAVVSGPAVVAPAGMSSADIARSVQSALGPDVPDPSALWAYDKAFHARTKALAGQMGNDSRSFSDLPPDRQQEFVQLMDGWYLNNAATALACLMQDMPAKPNGSSH